MRNFLLGMLVGVAVMALVALEVDHRRTIEMRLGRIEGYLGQLDKMLRGTSDSGSYQPDGYKRASR